MKKYIFHILYLAIPLLIYIIIAKSLFNNIKYLNNKFNAEIIDIEIESFEDNPGTRHIYTIQTNKGNFTESLDTNRHSVYKKGDKVYVVQKTEKTVRILRVNGNKVNSIINFGDLLVLVFFIILTTIILLFITQKIKAIWKKN